MNNKRHSFHLYCYGAISETEDRRANTRTKDAPKTLITQDVTKLLGVLCPRTVDKTEIYIFLL